MIIIKLTKQTIKIIFYNSVLAIFNKIDIKILNNILSLNKFVLLNILNKNLKAI